MSLADRGRYLRPLAAWCELFDQRLDIIIFEPYPLGVLGATLWNMLYCKGRAK